MVIIELADSRASELKIALEDVLEYVERNNHEHTYKIAISETVEQIDKQLNADA